MDRDFFEYRFSRHFNRFTYLGLWSTDGPEVTATPKKPYLISIIFIYFLLMLIVSLQALDLYYDFGDFEKVAFNLCSSALVSPVLLKIKWIHGRRRCVNGLRLALYRDFLQLKHPEDKAVLDRAFSDLNKMNALLYFIVLTIFFSVTLTYSYAAFWLGSTELPFAAYIYVNYPLSFFLEFLSVLYIGCVSAENELIGFSLILQVNAYYEILQNKLKRMDEIYEAEDELKKENSEREAMAKATVKACVIRHLELMEYVNKLEYIYSRCMLLQLIVGGFLILINGLVLFVFAKEFSRKLFFQMFFAPILISDLLLVCHYTSKLPDQCEEVGNAAYSTVWYKMDMPIKKSLYLLMIRIRKPPKMTAGKLIVLDLHTYMLLLRNIFSWLMLIRGLVNKKK